MTDSEAFEVWLQRSKIQGTVRELHVARAAWQAALAYERAWSRNGETPTEDDIAAARQIVSVGRLMDPDCKSDALLRKYVLREKT